MRVIALHKLLHIPPHDGRGARAEDGAFTSSAEMVLATSGADADCAPTARRARISLHLASNPRLRDAVKRSADLLAALVAGERNVMTELVDKPTGVSQARAMIREMVHSTAAASWLALRRLSVRLRPRPTF